MKARMASVGRVAVSLDRSMNPTRHPSPEIVNLRLAFYAVAATVDAMDDQAVEGRRCSGRR